MFLKLGNIDVDLFPVDLSTVDHIRGKARIECDDNRNVLR